jgi:PKD repeat protein
MSGSRVREPSGRGATAVAAVGALVAAVLAVLGVTAPPAAAADTITFRASAQAAFNQTTARVTIPSAVQEGDGMLLFVTTNVANLATTTPPAGWTLEGSRLSGSDTETSLYSRVATADDAGRNAAVTFPSIVKSTLNLLAYDGTAADPVATFAAAAETTSRATHITPGANVATAGSYVVSYWADKSSSTNAWTVPAGQTQRSTAIGVGSGRVTSVASDANAGSAAGASPAVTATADAATAKATMWSVVLQADQGTSPNVAPVASFTVSCSGATCTMDAAASTDTAPGTVASYAWSFGDGTTGTGVTANHTYTSAGAKTVTLTVTDNQGLASAPVTRTANPTLPPPTGGDDISFRGSDQIAWNQTTARAVIPASVRETDGLLLFVTTNLNVNITSPPAGWTLEGTRLSSNDTETTLYSRVAAANDAGRNAAVTFSTTTKATLTLLAYDGTGADPVADFASAAETVSRATHATPTADVANAGSYVVSYWADKSSSATAGWTLPAGQTQRSIVAGTGTGRISAVASDLNAAAPLGQTAARTATSAVASAKATMWTIVLRNDQATAPNVAPVASFTVTCPTATCTVDGSGSTDTAPGTVASYAWDFGDGSTGTGATTTHTYATGGAKTITLVVTDDRGMASAPATRTANPVVGGGGGTQPVPGHTRLVPDLPRNNTPLINNGEIWDIEVIPSLNRVFVAGNFTSIQNNASGNTTTYNQAGLASYNYQTGLVDASFRPTFNGGVQAVEASPDGTKLFVGGSFNTVNGVAKQKVASLNLTTGAPLSTFGFSNSTNNQVQSLAASNSTLYVGGRYTRVNGALMTGLAAVNAASGVVDPTFDNQISGGIGTNGQLGIPQLKLTHDGTKLLVIHTGRKIDGQDRLGMAIIDTATKQLLPWRSTLWDENLARVGGVTRIYNADIAPDDSYFVVSSGSGGDAPPVSDTAIAYSLSPAALQDSDNQYLWISRHFDSIYSVAITEQAVYVGGHFQFIESPTSDDPWPGLDNVGYGTGQGLAAYGLGDQVVRRDHIAAISPTTGKALEWNPLAGSNSFEGNKAMEATSRGLFIGGDGQFQGGIRTGRVAFYDFNSVTFPPAAPDTTITTPIEGRVVENNVPFDITGTARVATGNVGRVQVSVRDRDSGQYLQDNGTAFTTFGSTNNSLNATLAGTGANRTWSIPATVTTNRNLLVTAQTFTAATGGTGDSTPATKRFESFSIDDQTPTTNITGPSNSILTSSTFTMTGTATDDEGINSITFYFRDAQGRYLQNDGTVDDIYNSFRGAPDVIGATNATWSYDVTLPHEGEWVGAANAVDTAGQSDLRAATRTWTIDANAVAPTVAIQQPVAMTPPFTVPALTVEPGGRITFSGTASDDEGLRNVEVTLRNSSTGETLGADCTWGAGITAGNCRISPVDISGSNYNWTYLSPVLTPGSYSFTVRATDDDDLTTSSTNQGRLTVNANYAGDLPPDTTMAFTAPTDGSLTVNLAGTAGDDLGVANVRVSLQERDSGRYLQANGSMGAAVAYREATLGTPGGTSTTWSLPAITLPSGGNWRFTATAFDAAHSQQDSSPATGNYRLYPGDGPPTLNAALTSPPSGATFNDGKIVVNGRAEDAADANASIARVEIGVVNAAGQWMSSSGTFTSTSPSYRTAFLNSPGSAGSNYSYTTPVIPSGTYSVRIRPVDVHDQIGAEYTATGVVVSQPANNPPVPSFTFSCSQNVCTFDGRASTDESPSSLTYTWSFGSSSGTTVNGSGPLPTRTFTSPSPAGAPFQVTLTVKDEWQSSVTSAPQSVTIVEPTGNTAPVPTFTQSCLGLTCSVNSQGTADPQTGDTIAYSWNWGDGTAASTGASPSAHTYAAAGPYVITLTTTDGWGKVGTTTRNVSLTEPAGNAPPTPVFTSSCATYTTCQFNSAGTVDPDGDTIRYAWTFGDSGTSTSANPSRTYAAPGTYTVTLTTTDVWGRSASVTHDVTMTEPAGNTGPTGTFVATCTVLTCATSSTGTADPEGHTIKGYSWSWGDGTVLSTGASPSHTYAAPGTYTITMTPTDSWNRAGAPITRTVTMAEPGGNAGPTATFTVTCATTTTCTTNSTGTADPEGHTPLRYVWSWGDGTPDTVGSSSSPSHVYAVPGTYTVTLTVSDSWGRAGAPVTRTATTPAEPAGNTGPAVTFPQPTCSGLACPVSSAGTTDPDGIRGYSWSWGDGTPSSTGASPAAHTYAAAGTYTIQLVVTDNWGRTSTVSRTVSVT